MLIVLTLHCEIKLFYLAISKILQILGLQLHISKVFSRSHEQFFLTVDKNNFGKKIPIFFMFEFRNFLVRMLACTENLKKIIDHENMKKTPSKVAYFGYFWGGLQCLKGPFPAENDGLQILFFLGFKTQVFNFQFLTRPDILFSSFPHF